MLVDLAMISAEGQGDEVEEIVSIFHSAVLGYAPLIFNLKRDSSLDTFLECCRTVWRSLDSDRRLPDKLVCCCLHACSIRAIPKKKYGGDDRKIF